MQLKTVITLTFFTFRFTDISAQTTKTTSGNPIVEGWYADPEGVILNKEFWVFPTFSAKYKDQVFLDAFSSKDIVNISVSSK